MDDDPAFALLKKLSDIETIALGLSSVGKRSELHVKAQQLFVLINEARSHADALKKEIISLKYEYPAQRFERQKGVKRG